MRACRSHIYAVLGYCIVALAFCWPLPLSLSTTLTGAPSGDTGVYVWNQWLFHHELTVHRHLPLFTPFIFSLDSAADLSLHNYTIFADLLALPLLPLLGTVATFNIVYMALMVMTGYTMFLLATELAGGRVEAWLAGVLFAFSPALVTRGAGHFSLVAAAPLPLFALLLLRLERRRHVGYAIAAGAVMAWAVTCDPYYGVYCVLIAAWAVAVRTLSVRFLGDPGGSGSRWRFAADAAIAVLLGLMIAVAVTGGGEIRLLGWTVGLRSLYTPALALTVLLVMRFARCVRLRRRSWGLSRLFPVIRLTPYGAAVCVVLLSPLLVVLGRRIAEGRYVAEPVYWRSSMPGVDLFAFLMPNPNHPLLGRLSYQWLAARNGGLIENVASVTFVAVAVVALAILCAAFRPPRAWLAGTLCAASLAVGPFLRVGGFNTCLPTPWALLRYVPFVGAARAPGRFVALLMLGVAVLFALALRHLASARPAWRRPVLAVVSAALLFELAPVPRRLYSAEIPAIYRRVAADPRGVRVLELPFGVRDGLSSAGDFSPGSQFYQTYHHKKLIGGYLSRVSRRRFTAIRGRPILNALLVLSERKSLPAGAAATLAPQARRFIERSALAYVVIDRTRATPELISFATEVFGLEKLDQADGRELYRTFLARTVPPAGFPKP